MFVQVAIITDGDDNLITTSKKAFRKAYMTRCFIHFRDNCADFLKNRKVLRQGAEDMLELVFGINGKIFYSPLN